MFDDSTEFKSICQLADLLNRLKKIMFLGDSYCLC